MTPAAVMYGPWRHWLAAISEGLCPVHAIPLEPAAAAPGRISGHCAPCRKFWGVNVPEQVAGCWTDRDPAWPWRYPVPVPDWMQP